jgi:hypothetical protein
MADDENQSEGAPRRAYLWPWWVLGAVLLGVLLAILWMSQEIARTRTIRDLNAPAPRTETPKP